jgi:dTDP-glucose 4,6-dehydratase
MNSNGTHASATPDPRTANILVTGGAGFIGSNFIRYVFEKTDFKGALINYDKLTYAGNLSNLTDIDKKYGGTSYFFERGDIRDYETVKNVIEKHRITIIVHFAAESHVDRSIFGPKEFVETNVNGTFTLIEAARQFWPERTDVRFHHISTDEVYGSLGETGFFFETTPYDPRSPYSASKAASDHLVRAYYHTYGLPATISNCSNNYGSYHFPEKLVPLIILNAIEGKPLPVYGDGKNVRDWLYVEDHCEAIWLILAKGRPGETYNVGGECEKQNIEVVHAICDVLEELHPLKNNPSIRNPKSEIRNYRDLITFVGDRPGHDRRYAINCDKIKAELGWMQRHPFEEGLRETIAWYLRNGDWVNSIRSGDYAKWIEKNYTARL